MWIIKNVIGDDLLAKLVASSRYKDVREFKEWEAHKDAYICEFYEKVISLAYSDGIPPANELT